MPMLLSCNVSFVYKRVCDVNFAHRRVCLSNININMLDEGCPSRRVDRIPQTDSDDIITR